MDAVWDVLGTPVAQGVLWVAVLAILGVIAWYYLSSLRDRTKEDYQPSDHLAHFREMHGQGALSEAEYRKIKSNLNVHFRKDTHGSSQ